MTNKQAIKILKDLALSQKLYGTPEQYKATVRGLEALQELEHQETVSGWVSATFMFLWLGGMIFLWFMGY